MLQPVEANDSWRKDAAGLIWTTQYRSCVCVSSVVKAWDAYAPHLMPVILALLYLHRGSRLLKVR